MKPKYADCCDWFDAVTGKCLNPNKDRSPKTATIAGHVVDVTWNGKCIDEETANDIRAGKCRPPLACDMAECDVGSLIAKSKPFTSVCPRGGRKGFEGQRMKTVYDRNGDIVCCTSVVYRTDGESKDLAELIAKALNQYGEDNTGKEGMT